MAGGTFGRAGSPRPKPLDDVFLAGATTLSRIQRRAVGGCETASGWSERRQHVRCPIESAAKRAGRRDQVELVEPVSFGGFPSRAALAKLSAALAMQGSLRYSIAGADRWPRHTASQRSHRVLRAGDAEGDAALWRRGDPDVACQGRARSQ